MAHRIWNIHELCVAQGYRAELMYVPNLINPREHLDVVSVIDPVDEQFQRIWLAVAKIYGLKEPEECR